MAFIASRAAYVGQTALYGYLKTRMGIQYPAFFEDEAFAESINLAKSRVHVACLADFTVFAVALATRHRAVARADCEGLANHCFARALELALAEGPLNIDAEAAAAGFAARVEDVEWPVAAIGESAFADSPRELFEAAPIADELKQYDRGIVTNSIRFRWRDPRDQLRRRLDAEALWTDWSRSRAGPSPN